MDKRLVKRGAELLAKMTQHRIAVIRQISTGAAEEMAYYRYLRNTKVAEKAINATFCETTNGLIKGQHVLVLGDSTMMDYSSHRGRIQAGTGLGHIGDSNGYGYNAQVNLVIDAQTACVYGLGAVKLWHRQTKHSEYHQLLAAGKQRNLLAKKAKSAAGFTEAEAAEWERLSAFSVCIKSKTYTSAYQIPLAERESYRWVEGCEKTSLAIPNASAITYIHDREGDLYDTFVQIPSENRHLLIRSRNNRRIVGDGKDTKLYDYRHDVVALGQQVITLRDRATGKPRTTTLCLKAARVALTQRVLNAYYQVAYPKELPVYVVYAEELAECVAVGSAPIFWCLLTTHPVETLAQAAQMTYWYSLRWQIEQLFRLLKTDGFQLETSEIETGYALRKLGLFAMQAAIHVLQLKQARDGDETLPIEAVFTPPEITCLAAILPTLAGKTAKQQNPYPISTLPWAAWVIARLGGWKGYKNDRPPGILTLRNGLDRFKQFYQGFLLTG